MGKLYNYENYFRYQQRLNDPSQARENAHRNENIDQGYLSLAHEVGVDTRPSERTSRGVSR